MTRGETGSVSAAGAEERYDVSLPTRWWREASVVNLGAGVVTTINRSCAYTVSGPFHECPKLEMRFKFVVVGRLAGGDYGRS